MANLSTQDFLEIDKIKDGVVILKNKGLRIVLMVSSLNFALKSEDEQNAIIYQFQNFLNSLDFFCQFLVQSRQINITGYLDKLSALEKNEENQLLKIQISDYVKFVQGLTEGGAIMQKNFYVIVPFSLAETKAEEKGEGGKLIKLGEMSETEFQRAKTQIWQRTEFVALGLRTCGLEAIPLNSTELMELFWSLHHPLEAEKGYYPDIPPELIQ